MAKIVNKVQKGSSLSIVLRKIETLHIKNKGNRERENKKRLQKKICEINFKFIGRKRCFQAHYGKVNRGMNSEN